jgi:predicted transcriptional regulator
MTTKTRDYKDVDLSKIEYKTFRVPVNLTDEQFEALQIQKIEEAIKSLDEGYFVPHADVSNWLNSLGTLNPLPRPVAQKR